ncbi:hypothetical protein [Aeromonas caviae]|uniref:hypothetical protein n=1 Tax=Aeromonas TaxID=642 RepID=UPI000FE4297D|nr:hypothetical protein [Aeromonas caviae]MXQ71548.1 hypothetical protein [Aeromonas caviae]RWS98846.1 hypothetical protein DN600_20370 [Aeromonas caviae]
MPHFRHYQINELVSASHRDQIDLRAYRRALELTLQAVFGFDLQRVVVKRRFYAYSLKDRKATRREKMLLGQRVVLAIPALIPAIKSYPLRYPEAFRTSRRLFQYVKAKKRLAEIGPQLR